MGDMGDFYRDYNDHKKKRKLNNQSKNMEIINNSGIEYRTDQSGSVLIKHKIGTLCFYPTTNKFMVKGKVYRGNAKSFLGFIKNRGLHG